VRTLQRCKQTVNVELKSERVTPRQGGGCGERSDQSAASDISESVVVNNFHHWLVSA
jgi:hypothetical protein